MFPTKTTPIQAKISHKHELRYTWHLPRASDSAFITRQFVPLLREVSTAVSLGQKLLFTRLAYNIHSLYTRCLVFCVLCSSAAACRVCCPLYFSRNSAGTRKLCKRLPQSTLQDVLRRAIWWSLKTYAARCYYCNACRKATQAVFRYCVLFF